MTYRTIIQKDAENQRFYAVVVDDTGAEHPHYGKIELALDDIRVALALAGAVPATGYTADDCATIQFRELKYCDPDTGAMYYMLVPCGAPYTKT